MDEFKNEYNKLLKRFEKANEYFNDADIPQKEKEQQLENFREILVGLNYWLGKIELYTSQEIMGGF